MNLKRRVCAPAATPRLWARWCSLDNRYLAPMLITCILAAGQLSFGILESYARTVLAILTALCLELLLARLIRGQWPHAGQRLYHGDQRRDFAPLTGHMAVCAL